MEITSADELTVECLTERVKKSAVIDGDHVVPTIEKPFFPKTATTSNITVIAEEVVDASEIVEEVYDEENEKPAPQEEAADVEPEASAEASPEAKEKPTSESAPVEDSPATPAPPPTDTILVSTPAA